eukprot:TRINITY_DN3801_c0_g1_i1.p1 TRINITY_DN3801_c0_g1~~TRINITY_DN3801_c0_g1_i1.p1  ORF type:complete len:103 (-),score=3.61 TRINITY_DN3801_c0_g1_i1:239-547(-)
MFRTIDHNIRSNTQAMYQTKYFPHLGLSPIYKKFNLYTQKANKYRNSAKTKAGRKRANESASRTRNSGLCETKGSTHHESQFATIKSPYKIHIRPHMECVFF